MEVTAAGKFLLMITTTVLGPPTIPCGGTACVIDTPCCAYFNNTNSSNCCITSPPSIIYDVLIARKLESSLDDCYADLKKEPDPTKGYCVPVLGFTKGELMKY